MTDYQIFYDQIAEIAARFNRWMTFIEVPPHGRLIDADELPLTEGWFNTDKERNVYQIHIIFVLENDIKNAPTIIEAEGEDGSN